MTTIVPATTPGEFVHLVPSMLGYVPEDSIVITPMVGDRTIAAVRFNIPADGDSAHADQFAAMLRERLPSMTGIIGLVYGPEDMHLFDRCLDFIERVATLLDAQRFPTFFVTPDRWLTSRGEEGVIDTLRLAGLQRGPVSPVTPAGPWITKQFVLATITLLQEGWHPDPVEAGLRVDAEMEYTDLAKVHIAIAAPSMRDAMIATAVYGEAFGSEVWEAQQAFLEGEPFPDHLALFLMGEGERPDFDRVEVLYRTCRDLVAINDGAPAQSVAAWAAWALGRSSQAQYHLEAAVEADPEYTLAQLLLAIARAGHTPTWVRG